MIEPSVYISFLIVSALVIVVPGPNVLLIVTTALTKGRRRGFQTIIGTVVAMALQLLIAAKGTIWFAETLAETFQIFKWFGAAYLIYLGVTQLRRAISDASTEQPELTGSGTFIRGFIVGITNPKTIAFFGAFLPQFTSSSLPMEPQLFTLSLSFLVLALLCDGAYLMLAASLTRLSKRPRYKRWTEAVGGTIFFGSGMGLAFSRN